jgi:hypothetical protein
VPRYWPVTQCQLNGCSLTKGRRTDSHYQTKR